METMAIGPMAMSMAGITITAAENGRPTTWYRRGYRQALKQAYRSGYPVYRPVIRSSQCWSIPIGLHHIAPG